MWRENVAMEIAETFIAAKTGRDRDCEDGIVVTDSLAAVIDGATDKTGYRFQGLTGGRYAMLACADALHSLDGGADALETVAHLSMVLAERLPPGLAPDERPEAAVTIYSRPRHEVWQVGDVGFWHPGARAGGIRPCKTVDRYTGILRAAVLRAHLADGVDSARLAETDPGRVAIAGLLASQGTFRNSRGVGRWAYGAIDGRPVPSELVAVHPVPGAAELVIASDGYPVILPTLASSEEQLATLIAEDPLCVGPLRGTKGVSPGNISFDDRAYLRLRL
jgi:hypothetical protein